MTEETQKNEWEVSLKERNLFQYDLMAKILLAKFGIADMKKIDEDEKDKHEIENILTTGAFNFGKRVSEIIDKPENSEIRKAIIDRNYNDLYELQLFKDFIQDALDAVKKVEIHI